MKELRLGFIRVLRFPTINLPTQLSPMLACWGYQLDFGHTSIQVANHWWGFGKDG